MYLLQKHVNIFAYKLSYFNNVCMLQARFTALNDVGSEVDVETSTILSGDGDDTTTDT